MGRIISLCTVCQTMAERSGEQRSPLAGPALLRVTPDIFNWKNVFRPIAPLVKEREGKMFWEKSIKDPLVLGILTDSLTVVR